MLAVAITSDAGRFLDALLPLLGRRAEGAVAPAQPDLRSRIASGHAQLRRDREARRSPDRVTPFDFLTTYMDMPRLPQRPEPYPYDLLIKHAEAGWLRYAEHSSKPYVPYVPSGWDPRPWQDPRPSFASPTREEWTAALNRVKAALDKYPKLGIPMQGGRKKMVLIYAWNEFGEGGCIAPTKGDPDGKYLKALKGVVNRANK